MDPLDKADFGQMLEASVVEKGLRELNQDINFDLATRKGMEHPYQDSRQGVYYREKHVCSMDRGILPEFKIWATHKRVVEIPWHDADKEDASIAYVEVTKDTPNYQDLYEIGKKGSDPQYMVNDRGKLLRLQALGYRQVGRRCVRVGWRHTFERLLAEGIPGVTRESIARKFGVDMYKFPVGTPEELVAALVEE